MAIIDNPALGKIRKSFAGAVFYQLNGKTVMRSKPFDLKDAKTPAQLHNRSKMTLAVKLVRSVLRVINKAYAGTLVNKCPYNKTMSITLKKAISGNPPVVDYRKFVLCTFKGSTIKNVQMNAQPCQKMNITWKAGTTHPGELASKITFILFNCLSNEVRIFDDFAIRSAGKAIIQTPASWVGNQTALHVITYDYTRLVAKKPMHVIKFMAGIDLASTVLG
jgi:hypothetical protein